MSTSHLAECPDLGPECASDTPPVPFNHHIQQWIAETSLSVDFSVTDWLSFGTRWSLRVADINPSYTEQDGSPKEVKDDIHHHDETLVDVTDPWFLARFSSTHAGLTGALQLGASLPVGRTEPDPYRLGQEGERHEHLQAGSGTVIPIVGFSMSAPIAPVTISLSGFGFFNAMENAEGYQAPVRMNLSHRVDVSLFEGVFQPFVEATLTHEGEEFWQGHVGLEGTNVRSEIYLGGGALWQFDPHWGADVSVRGRVATLTDAPAFEGFAIFGLGLTARYDLLPDGPKPAEPTAIDPRREGGVTVFEKP